MAPLILTYTCLGQSNIANGNNADENQVSNTSSSENSCMRNPGKLI